MALPTETEFKLKSPANFQLKFSPVETAEVIINKLEVLCNLLDIQLGSIKKSDIVDEYFDDENMSLWNRKCTFRKRQVDDKYRVTIKLHSKSPELEAVQRLEDEFDCTDAEVRRLVDNPTELISHINNTWGESFEAGKLRKLLSIQNRRTSIGLKTSAADYRFCYDKYYYFDEINGRFSEYFSEIEIEFEGGNLPDDRQLSKLRNALSKLLQYTPSYSTKLERGLEWRHRAVEELRTVYVVAFDIVDYTQRTSDLQKKMILTLNRITKEAIKAIRGKGAESNVIYIPTGDGMILVFEDRPETILPIVLRVQAWVKEHAKNVPSTEGFSFRTGLHAGPVFKYSDVNENLNFAGNGINMAARAMSLGDEWHILATNEANEAMGGTSKHFAGLFSPLGDFKIKHGQTLRIFNVVDRDWQCGNPARPR